MNFRLVWMGPDDEPDQHSAKRAGAVVSASPSRVLYEQHGTQMVRREHLEDGRVKFIPLANFTARIVRDTLWDDDVEQRREFGVEAEMAGQKFTFTVPAAEFSRMGWVLRRLGPQAVIYPGQQQHARAAIQCLSSAIRQERVYTHLGWRKHGLDWVYLQAGGAVAAAGPTADLQVRLPASLRYYQVQAPVDRAELTNAVRSSLGFLSIAPDRISLPLLAAVYRAPLGGVDFGLFLTGRSGTFKTALAALCQQHFGAEMNARRLPGNFASTANALEELAFLVKDALLVIDDFVPIGGAGDSALEALAERLFRAAGNRQGRGRLAGLQLRAPHPPGGLLLATGEQVPRGHSIRARLLIVELRPREVNRAELSRSQAIAEEGQFAAAMGGYAVLSVARARFIGQRRCKPEDAAGASHPGRNGSQNRLKLVGFAGFSDNTRWACGTYPLIRG